jgi:ribonuclease T1
VLVGVAVVLLAWVLGHGAFSGAGASGVGAPTRSATVSATSLPAEARQTLALIDSGGPFPYDQDGVVFGNREGLLPDHDNGYYHEYTVPTPGSPDRGARRIITGAAGERYYTDDHYRSFERISP